MYLWLCSSPQHVVSIWFACRTLVSRAPPEKKGNKQQQKHHDTVSAFINLYLSSH